MYETRWHRKPVVYVQRQQRECQQLPDEMMRACIFTFFAAIDLVLFSDVDVDVVDLRAQADASMPASNNNVNYTIYSNF